MCILVPSMVPMENHQVVFTELQLPKICSHLPYIPSFCSDAQPAYMAEGVKSLRLTGKCYPLLPHSCRRAYNQTGLIPQGLNAKVFKAKKKQ